MYIGFLSFESTTGLFNSGYWNGDKVQLEEVGIVVDPYECSTGMASRGF